MAALRSATAASHQRLEKRLNVKSRFTGIEAYRSYLEGMWGFCAGLEQSLSRDSFGGALPDYDARRKLPLLTQDLLTIGSQGFLSGPLERCTKLPTLLDTSAAFGCTYVLEGATLGGRSLLPLVKERLGFTPDHGAAYLASYGDKVTAMWVTFGAALDESCSHLDGKASAARFAVMTFETLTDWLCAARP